MRRREFLSQLAGGGWSVCLLGFSGCGTVLYKERVGQPHSRDIDWKVAGLNGLGLVLFFVPGVVAFAVDFYTGAIYLPPEYPVYDSVESAPPQPMQPSQQPTASPKLALQAAGTAAASTSHSDRPATRQGDLDGELQRVMVPRSQLNLQRIESVVGDRIGRPGFLLDGHTRISELPHLDRFAQQCRRHNHDAQFGTTARAFFAGLPKA